MVVIGSAGSEERLRESERERVTECERPPAQHLCRLPFDQLSLSPIEDDRKRERGNGERGRRLRPPRAGGLPCLGPASFLLFLALIFF